MSKIENLVRFSVKTFLQRREALHAASIAGTAGAVDHFNAFHNLFSELITHASNITGDDVGLSRLLQYPGQLRRQKPTALHCEIYDNSLLSICIFVLYPKARIPLHSHPGMYGVLKLLHGELVIKSYSGVKPIDSSASSISPLEAVVSTCTIDSFSQPAVVTPDKNNLHEILNENNDFAVFLDILSPRYENDNCYFTARQTSGNMCKLFQIACPPTFHTVSVPFPFQSQFSFERHD